MLMVRGGSRRGNLTSCVGSAHLKSQLRAKEAIFWISNESQLYSIIK